MWRQLSSFPRLDRTLVIQILLVGFWLFTLSWGERRAFSTSVDSCEWDTWEKWPAYAQPHRLVLIADPQLVDPHTYPGRPWPLSSLTIRHTDQYMRRSSTFIQNTLKPQTVLFLGDLFDGGREWSTWTSKSPERRWHKYDDKYWLDEYSRFGKIFLDPYVARLKREGSPVTGKLHASLPGNHDLGFSTGIQIPVRNRFQTYFGRSNRVDIIGNHSFVSVDTVSLSAKAGHEGGLKGQPIWAQADDFLQIAKKKKAQALQTELDFMFKRTKKHRLNHQVLDAKDFGEEETHIFGAAGGDMPTVLLTHVPLYRESGTPCGPLRERYPPSVTGTGEAPVVSDEANALKVAGGYQYQNVLHDGISKELISQIGEVQQVFSGDDHDYCEVVHKNYGSSKGGVREITVKSISWAMGVRKPGFLLVSLWNPVDEKGDSVGPASGDSPAPTIQTHSCLIPDQLSIFVHYLQLLILTIVVLVVDSLFASRSTKQLEPDRDPILPVSNTPRTVKGRTRADSTSFSTSSHSTSQVSSRSNASRSRTGSPPQSYGYGVPMMEEPEGDAMSNYTKNLGAANGSYTSSKEARAYQQQVPPTRTQVFLRHFRRSMLRVAAGGLFWYAWLALTV